MIDFTMPSLGADMEEAVLAEWVAQPGDALKRGDIIAVVETQKGAIEIEVFVDGVLEAQLVAPGAVLPVGAAMARIREAGEAQSAGASPAASVAPPARGEAPARAGIAAPAEPSPPPAHPDARPVAAPSHPPRSAGPAASGRELAPTRRSVRASPAARRLAQQRLIDLSGVTGTGPGGAILYADVAAHMPAPATAKAAGYDYNQMRRAIGAAMARSKREIPHYYLQHTIDIGRALDWLAAWNAERNPAARLLLGALFVKAVAQSARAYPEFNGFYVDGAFRPSAAIHVGLAISIRGGGLVAPAIHDAADLDLAALMVRMRDLVGRVRAGRFRSSEIADPTITVSSLGDRGVDALWGVIYPPQVAIVGFGAPAARPFAFEGEVALRPTIGLTLSADHRASDGHRGALFLAHIGEKLAIPGEL